MHCISPYHEDGQGPIKQKGPRNFAVSGIGLAWEPDANSNQLDWSGAGLVSNRGIRNLGAGKFLYCCDRHDICSFFNCTSPWSMGPNNHLSPTKGRGGCLEQGASEKSKKHFIIKSKHRHLYFSVFLDPSPFFVSTPRPPTPPQSPHSQRPIPSDWIWSDPIRD